MNPTLVFVLVIVVESLAVIVVIAGVCFLIWGDFSVESEAGVRRKAPSASPKKARASSSAAAPSTLLQKKTASSKAAAPPSPPKVRLTKTAPASSTNSNDG